MIVVRMYTASKGAIVTQAQDARALQVLLLGDFAVAADENEDLNNVDKPWD